MAEFHDNIFCMPNSLKMQVRHAIEVAIAFTPWVASMFVFYWLEYGQIWTTEAAHRGKIAVAILATGMGLSFLIQSYFAKRRQR